MSDMSLGMTRSQSSDWETTKNFGNSELEVQDGSLHQYESKQYNTVYISKLILIFM